ncbi:hypothetical protein N9888_00995 [Akkermansiaceae bacterium]|nr:hypothetical protein [Akkermansiaceae bacterium]
MADSCQGYPASGEIAQALQSPKFASEGASKGANSRLSLIFCGAEGSLRNRGFEDQAPGIGFDGELAIHHPILRIDFSDKFLEFCFFNDAFFNEESREGRGGKTLPLEFRLEDGDFHLLLRQRAGRKLLALF